MAKVYINQPKKLVALTLAGVQTTCCSSEGRNEWPDEVFQLYVRDGMEEGQMLADYRRNRKNGLRFYVEVE